MPTTDILCLRGRRGTSTTFGTLIFVGILFTAVVPMFLFMRQADTLYEQKKLELGCLDEERSREDLYIYIYPLGGATSTDLRVTAQNKGELMVRVVRLWLNDDPFELDHALQPMSGVQELGTYTVSPQPGDSYFITAITDRGRLVGFDTPLTWQDGLWITDIYSVNVLINSLPGHDFKIVVSGEGYTSPETHTEKFDPKFFIVPQIGEYTVEIFRGFNLLYTEVVTITWPDGPPVEWVFA